MFSKYGNTLSKYGAGVVLRTQWTADAVGAKWGLAILQTIIGCSAALQARLL
jgi:hypothetical protein